MIKTEKQSFKDKIENSPWKYMIISFVAGVSIMFTIMQFVLEYTGLYRIKNNKSGITTTVKPIIVRDTLVLLSQEYKNKLHKQIYEKGKEFENKKIDTSVLDEKEKMIFIAAELDVIYGQMQIIETIVKQKKIAQIVDSLNILYDEKQKKLKKYNN